MPGGFAAVGGSSFREVLRGLGLKGGGLTKVDVAELERLDKTGAAARGAADKREPRKVAFRCDMLMARGSLDGGDAAWRCMSCEDPFDYAALSQSRYGFFDKLDGVLWQPGDVAVLLDADGAGSAPVAGGRFERFATVIAAQAAGDDKEKLENQ